MKEQRHTGEPGGGQRIVREAEEVGGLRETGNIRFSRDMHKIGH